MKPVLVMTDSTCDWPHDWIARYDVRVVPTYVHFAESLADDGQQLPGLSSTADCPPSPSRPRPRAAARPGARSDAPGPDRRRARHRDYRPATLSGIYNTFRLAAEQSAPERHTD